MQNLYEALREDLHYNKFVVGDLLLVEYTCPIEEESSGLWTQMDYLVHVLSGRKTWRTTHGQWEVSGGETLYVRKGAMIVDQDFEDDFCLLAFFIPDDFTRRVLREVSGTLKHQYSAKPFTSAAVRVNHDLVLSAYFQSMLSYFSGDHRPSDSLLELKLKELILNILSSPHNPSLAAYLHSMAGRDKPSLQQIMEANFAYNFSLDEFARMCHRSLSSFKRDFQRQFNVSPGKWLQAKRLEYAAMLLCTSDMNITQVVYECGFEDASHFSRTFKQHFGRSPMNFRKERGLAG